MKDNVKDSNESKLRNDLNSSLLNSFANVYGDLLHVSPISQLRETEVSGHKRHYQDLAKLNGVLSKFSGAPCIYWPLSWGEQVVDKLIHYITACSKYESTRAYFWALIIHVFLSL